MSISMLLLLLLVLLTILPTLLVAANTDTHLDHLLVLLHGRVWISIFDHHVYGVRGRSNTYTDTDTDTDTHPSTESAKQPNDGVTGADTIYGTKIPLAEEQQLKAEAALFSAINMNIKVHPHHNSINNTITRMTHTTTDAPQTQQEQEQEQEQEREHVQSTVGIQANQPVYRPKRDFAAEGLYTLAAAHTRTR